MILNVFDISSQSKLQLKSISEVNAPCCKIALEASKHWPTAHKITKISGLLVYRKITSMAVRLSAKL